MNDNEWLNHLKVGDEVAINTGLYWNLSYKIAVVDRLTKTRIIVDGDAYRRTDGKAVGKHYGGSSIVEATSELRAAIAEIRHRRSLLDKVHKMPRPEGMTTPQLEAIVSAWDLVTKEEKGTDDAA